MQMTDLLAKKRDGGALSTEEIDFMIQGYTREEIRRFVFELLDQNGSAGFVLGADCTIPSDTPVEHLIWAREACAEWSEKRHRTAFNFM